MTVYRLTRADRDLLLASADLEAVLADRERERLERDERTEARPGSGIIARLGYQPPEPGEDRQAPSEPIAA
jgi:hypothetical protein